MIDYIRVAVIFAAGIYLSERIAPSFLILLILFLILVLTVQAFFKHEFNAKILLAVIIFSAGVCLCANARDASRCGLYDYDGRYVTVTGRVCEIPYKTDGQNTSYVIKVGKIGYMDVEKEISEKIILSSPNTYEYGDTVRCSGFINRIDGKMNENGYDYARYYAIKRIFFKMYSRNTEFSPYKMHDYSPHSLGLYLKCFVSDNIDKRYKGDFAAILKAALTGNKKEFSPDFDAVLDRTGLKRFYYPAYLQVLLLMSFLSFALAAFDVKKRDAVTILFLIIYAIFNSDNNVFLKICIILALVRVLRTFLGYFHYLDVIGMTALIMGAVNPLVFYDVGFIFSMLSTILIYYFYGSVDKLLGFIKIKYIRRMTAIGIICNVGLIGVAAYFFNGVSLHSMFVSFLMMPCVMVLLILSPVLIAMLAVFGAAPVVGTVVTAAVAALYYIPICADKLSFLTVSLGKTDLLGLLIYLLAVVALVKFVKKKKRHMYMALFTAAALVVSVGINEAARLDDVEISFVNVGQGDGTLITAPHRFNVIIDGGGGNAYSDDDFGAELFLEYLRAEGIRTVDSAFVSHYHKDHAQGIVAAIEEMRVRNVFMPSGMEGSEWREKIETAARKNGTKIHYLTEEVLLRYNNGMTIRAVPPSYKTAINDEENDTSWVYYVTYGDFSAMFTGDMTGFAERNLLSGGKSPKTDLLKVAHHGSRTSTSREWVEALNPMYSVISEGEGNMYDFPHRETLENLKNTLVYRTDQDGDIRFTVEKDGVKDIETRRRER